MSRLRIVLRKPGIIPKRLLYKLEFFLWSTGLYASGNCERLERYRNHFKGRRVFLIGNGPSLASADLDTLHKYGEISFASNKIYLIYPQTPWRPTFYFAQDTPFAEKFHDLIFAQEEATQLVFPNIFFEQNLATAKSLRFILKMWDSYPELPKIGTSPAAFYYGGSVTYTMMQWAYYMGFKEIILLGVDADYRTDIQDKNLKSMIVTDNLTTHFIEDYYAPGEEHHPPNIKKQLSGYLSAQKFFAGTDVSVVNATRGGKLDIFAKADFDSLFI